MTLKNLTKNQIVVPHLMKAEGFWSRAKGLLGRTHLDEGEALWIPACNSIHTFFMKFSIDAVFVNNDLKVQKVCKNVQPGRLVLPVLRANSVFELAAGEAERLSIEPGDELHVDT